MMNNILKVFRFAGLSLIIISIIFISNHLISAIVDYNKGLISVHLVKKNVPKDVQVIDGAMFTNSHIGSYEFKPTLLQSILLSNDGIVDNGSNAVFYLILGSIITMLAYLKPKWLENLTENRLWQFVGAGSVLFFALKFLTKFLVDNCVDDLTHHAFKYYYSNIGDVNLNVMSIVAVLTVVYELLSYSRKLKQENDLTI